MHTEDAISIQCWDVVVFSGVLNFGSIYYRYVFVRGLLQISGVRVVVSYSKVCNIVIHGEADRALGVNGVVFPLQINAGVKVSLPVFSEFIVLGQSLFEV